MPLTNSNIDIYQGDDYAATVTVYNADGTPADITDYTARAQIRRAVADAEPVVTAEFTAVVQSPEIQLSLSHDVTAVLGGRYVWDLQIVSEAGTVTTILAGKVIAIAEVTRPEVTLHADIRAEIHSGTVAA